MLGRFRIPSRGLIKGVNMFKVKTYEDGVLKLGSRVYYSTDQVINSFAFGDLDWKQVDGQWQAQHKNTLYKIEEYTPTRWSDYAD